MGPPRRFRSHAYLPGLRTSEDQDHKENREETRGALAQHVQQGSYLLGTTATPPTGQAIVAGSATVLGAFGSSGLLYTFSR